MYELISSICSIFQDLADLVWGFPTNIAWYASLPVIGELPLVIILLVGTGIYFTCNLRFVQIKYFRYGLNVLINSHKEKQGISPLASFLLSTAMRVGPGNILGVTGAVSTGGPGALFWMWVSAFFGMATAFVESTLSQIYKEKQGDEYVGGLPCYGRRFLGGAAIIGGVLSFLYIIYALLCIPAQGFNTISAMVAVTQNLTGTEIAAGSSLIWGFFLLLMALTAFSIFGGLRRITNITDVLVPIMAVVYVVAVLVMVAMKLELLPWFFYVVVTEAFRPEPVFGGALGIALSQGIKRGLMSNEAGQGTLSMPAAVSYAKHPCDQGIIQAIGVFLDTIVICTLTGFVLIMGQAWMKDGSAAWFKMGRLEKFLASCAQMLGSWLWTCHIGHQYLLWYICLYLPVGLPVLFRNMRQTDFKQYSLHRGSQAGKSGSIGLWHDYEYCRFRPQRPLESQRLCQHHDGMLQPASSLSGFWQSAEGL